MKKICFLSLAALTMAGAAFAAPAKKAAKVKTTIECPVMKGHMVNIKQATASKKFVDFKGRRYFMCCDGCGPAFKADPTKYSKAVSLPIPGSKKKG